MEEHQSRCPASGTSGQRRRRPRARGARRTRGGTAPRPPTTGSAEPRCPARPAHRRPSAAGCSSPAVGGCPARPGRAGVAIAAGRPARPRRRTPPARGRRPRRAGAVGRAARRGIAMSSTAVSGAPEVLTDHLGRRSRQVPHEVRTRTLLRARGVPRGRTRTQRCGPRQQRGLAGSGRRDHHDDPRCVIRHQGRQQSRPDAVPSGPAGRRSPRRSRALPPLSLVEVEVRPSRRPHPADRVRSTPGPAVRYRAGRCRTPARRGP